MNVYWPKIKTQKPIFHFWGLWVFKYITPRILKKNYFWALTTDIKRRCLCCCIGVFYVARGDGEHVDPCSQWVTSFTLRASRHVYDSPARCTTHYVIFTASAILSFFPIWDFVPLVRWQQRSLFFRSFSGVTRSSSKTSIIHGPWLRRNNLQLLRTIVF